MIAKVTAAGVLLGASIATASPAAAQNSRSFVSGRGLDSNPCTLASPCRTFQRAHDMTNANGEVNVLDTAGYGTLVITKSISIINDGNGTASLAPATGARGISVNAGATDKVSLRGLTVDGAGKGDNYGIYFQSGAFLTIDRCNARNLTFGYFQRSEGKVSISDSRFTENANTNVYMSAGTFLIERTAALNGNSGFYFLGVAGQLNNVTAAFNGYGFFNSYSQVFLKDSVVSNNAMVGFYLNGGFALLTRNSINKNSRYGVQRDEAGTLYSFGDNAINGNATDVSGTLTKATLQ